MVIIYTNTNINIIYLPILNNLEFEKCAYLNYFIRIISRLFLIITIPKKTLIFKCIVYIDIWYVNRCLRNYIFIFKSRSNIFLITV